MTDITELTQSKSLRKKLNRRLNDAYGFQRTSGGKHTTISLSIAECKSVIAALEKHLALVEALASEKRICATWRKTAEANSEKLEKAQQQMTESENRVRKQNRHICELFDDNTALRQRIAGLESRTVKLPEPFELDISSSGLTYYYADEVDAALTAAGIKVEAE